MKEAISSPYKPIFRETFNSEQSVRNNGGVPTGVAIEKGIGSFNGTTSIISYNGCSYNYLVNTGLSIRIIFELTNLTWNTNNYVVCQYDSESNNRSWSVSFDANGQLVFRYSTNGISAVTAQSTVNLKALELNKTYEAMIVTRLGYVDFYLNGILMNSPVFSNNCFITNIPLTIGGTRTPNFTHKLGLIEIYEGTLTDSEIKNLYDNDWNKEFISSNLLLDYDSTNGYITDRTGKNTLTPTNVTIKKTGSYYSAEFNGVDSTLITDSTDPTIWQSGFTIVAWIKPRSWGGETYGRILDVSNNNLGVDGFYFSINYSTTSLFCKIHNAPARASGINSINIGSWQFVVLTVSSNSYINFYKGDIDVAPALSGDANQKSGLITSITTTNPVTIGNRSTATDRTFDGNIPILKVYEGILDLETITQIWSSTRGKVN